MRKLHACRMVGMRLSRCKLEQVLLPSMLRLQTFIMRLVSIGSSQHAQCLRCLCRCLCRCLAWHHRLGNRQLCQTSLCLLLALLALAWEATLHSQMLQQRKGAQVPPLNAQCLPECILPVSPNANAKVFFFR